MDTLTTPTPRKMGLMVAELIERKKLRNSGFWSSYTVKELEAENS